MQILMTKDNYIVKIFNIIKIDNESHNNIILICKKILNVNPLYNKPISSTIFIHLTMNYPHYIFNTFQMK